MELFDTTQLALDRAMSGAALRQTALADNLANANTPGYQRKDVRFEAALGNALAAGRTALDRLGFAAQTEAPTSTRADGNGVDVDVESSELARNGLQYQTLVQIARARFDTFETAMGQK